MPATKIQPVDIQEIAGVVPDAVVRNFAQVLGIEQDDGMDIDDAPKSPKTDYKSIQNQVKFLMREGYSATQIISQVNAFFFFE